MHFIRLRYFTCLSLALLLSSDSTAQFDYHNFSLRLSSGINWLKGSDNLMAVSAVLEPRYRFSKWTSIGVQGELGFHGFSEVRQSRSSVNLIEETESSLSRMRGLNVLGYVHFGLLGADGQAGIGVGYTSTSSHLKRSYTITDRDLVDMEKLERRNRFGLTYAVNFDLGKTFFGLKLTKSNVGDAFRRSSMIYQLTLGYRLIDEINQWEKARYADMIPVFALEFGSLNAMPMGGAAQAAAVKFFMEPKIALAKHLSLGFHFNLDGGVPKGYDNDDEYLISGSNGNSVWRKENRMAKLQSMLGTIDYYFPAKGGWYFLGGGIGEYQQEELKGYSSGSRLSGHIVNFPVEPAVNNFGFMLRGGLKTSLIRFGININFTGDGISDYFGLQVGFEPSFMRYNS